VLIGSSSCGDVIRLQGFPPRNGSPHHLPGSGFRQGRRDVWRALRIAAGPGRWWSPPMGTVLRNPTESRTSARMGMLRAIAKDKVYDVAIVGSGRPPDCLQPSMRRSEGLSSGCDARASEGRPAPAPASKITSLSNRYSGMALTAARI